MTTSRIPSDYYTNDEFTYGNNGNGIVTNKTRKGSYNIVEKDYGDHKIIYHVPIEYGDDYDISQLEDIPSVGIEDDEEQQQQQQQHNVPKLMHRRIYHQYDNYAYDNNNNNDEDDEDDDDDDDDDKYIEEVSMVKPRRRIYVSPRRQQNKQVTDRIYEEQPPIEKVEYLIEDNSTNDYNYRSGNQDEIQYIVRQRVPEQRHLENPRPIQRIVYDQNPSIPFSSSRIQPPASFPQPAPYLSARSPYQQSPRSIVNQKSPTLVPAKPTRRNEISPQPSSRKHQTARSPPLTEPSNKSNTLKSAEPPLRLMDVIAQNRAKRGSRIPKPRREIDEEKICDPPTYSRHIIKNGFIVHK